jgi:hypothetical protein
MTTVRVTGGILDVQAGNPGGIDNTLPGLQPGIDNTLPVPPPGIWPPPTLGHPIVPVPPDYPMPPGAVWPPVYPSDPGYGQGHPRPPHVGGGPIQRPPGYVSGQPLPGGEVDNELPEGSPPQTPVQPRQPRFLVAIVGASSHGGGLQVIGWTVVDPSLSVGMPLPGGRPPGYVSGQPVPPMAGNELPQTPEPKA